MTDRAEVVIIGGGIMGVSLLYHLAEAGWTDCILLEKAELTSGSTWHAAGQITHGLAHWGLGKINSYGVQLYRSLEEETGQSVTWHGCGSLRVAYTDDEVDFVRHILSVGRGLGEAIHLLDVAEAAKIHPFFNFDGVKAALYTPDDGHVDPAGATMALAAGARQRGAEIRRFTRCTGVQRLDDGQWRVETEKGDIVCRHVVNAAGAYAKQVASWVGYNLPMANTTHHYFVTEDVKEFESLDKELPVVRDDRTFSGYVRMEQRSGLIGIYEKTNANTVWDDGAPWEAVNELFEPDYDRLAPYLEQAIERMPVLENYGIKRAVHGAIPMPPDGQMLLGPAPGLPNYWCCCGSHVGIAWGPGAGKYLAQWMTRGTAEINMRDFDPRRFGPYIDRAYEIDRAKEDYVLRHEIPYPGLQRESGRPKKTSPLYQVLSSRGAIHEEIYGWERPRWFAAPDREAVDCYGWRRPEWYASVEAECRAVRERAGLMDLSAFAKIDVVGADAAQLLDRLVANRLPPADGGIRLTHLLNEAGTIEAEITVARFSASHYYIMCAAFSEQKVRDWLVSHVAPGEQVAVEPVSEELGCLVLSGPRSRDVLGALTSASLDNDSFPWLKGQLIEVAGVASVRALRLSYVGELGWELHAPMQGMETLYGALREVGDSVGMVDFGSFALNAMRLEKGFKGASELTNEVTLPEADVMRFCRLDKGEFVGRRATVEHLALAESGQLRWRCVALELDAGDADAIGGETVCLDGEPVGQVSSGGFGFYTEKSLAFAYVRPDAVTAPHSKLSVWVLNEARAARVLTEPVYDPDSLRPRQPH